MRMRMDAGSDPADAFGRRKTARSATLKGRIIRANGDGRKDLMIGCVRNGMRRTTGPQTNNTAVIVGTQAGRNLANRKKII